MGRIGIERRESVGEWDVLEQREVKNEEKRGELGKGRKMERSGCIQKMENEGRKYREVETSIK